MKTETATAPSHWATYFINADASGMDGDDIDAADAWLESLGWGAPVDCADAGFMTWHDARAFCPFAADCQEYVFLIQD